MLRYVLGLQLNAGLNLQPWLVFFSCKSKPWFCYELEDFALTQSSMYSCVCGEQTVGRNESPSLCKFSLAGGHHPWGTPVFNSTMTKFASLLSMSRSWLSMTLQSWTVFARSISIYLITFQFRLLHHYTRNSFRSASKQMKEIKGN